MNLKILLTASLALSGCSSLGNFIPEVNPVEVVQIQKKQAIYHPPLPSKVRTKPVEWKVLTPAVMDEYLSDLEKGEAPTNVYYGVSPTGYENLSLNMAEIKRYIKQVLSIVNYYKELDADEKEEDQSSGNK
tara:strand:+ start:35 stop:427 length:393 start_codon:yes stop_codon:yes gene_type:complete